jgi:hypothetical protein
LSIYSIDIKRAVKPVPCNAFEISEKEAFMYEAYAMKWINAKSNKLGLGGYYKCLNW